MSERRIKQLQGMLAARSSDGKPRKGFKKNVVAIKAEITRLRAL